MNYFSPLIVGLACLAGAPAVLADDVPLIELKDGDRIVLLGDTLIERDQGYGHLETLLTQQNPDKSFTLRNLGWSGDTVFGDARAGFGTQPDGFRHLKEHVLALKPTLLIVGYGMNESFEGEAGLSRFVEGLNTLLDALAPTKARLVLLSPIRHEDLGRPLPDPAKHNRDIELYSEAIRKVATDRQAVYVPLHELVARRKALFRLPALTDNGIHLTDRGYAVLGEVLSLFTRPIAVPGVPASLLRNARASEVVDALSAPSAKRPSTPWEVDITLEGGTPKRKPHENPKVAGLAAGDGGLRFEATDLALPVAPVYPASSPRRVSVKGLAPGTYALKVDGRAIRSADAEAWAAGVPLPPDGPEFDRVEALRKTINEKNLLYFYRWRPQNETYLFGFRKHEQGNNAREIPLFDPLVEAKEKEIARLKVPATHVYEWVRESEVGK